MFKLMTNAAVLALLSVFMAIPIGCATVDGDLVAITSDVKACVNATAPAAIQLVERNAGPALYDAFMCDAGDGFNPDAIPACLESALATETAGLGPYADEFKSCVVDKIEADKNIKPLAKKRAHLVKAKLAAAKR